MVCVHSTSSRPELAYGFYAAYDIRLKAFIKRSAIQPLMASSPAFYLGTYLYKAALATRPNSSARGQSRSRLDLCEAKFSVLFKLYHSNENHICFMCPVSCHGNLCSANQHAQGALDFGPAASKHEARRGAGWYR